MGTGEGRAVGGLFVKDESRELGPVESRRGEKVCSEC